MKYFGEGLSEKHKELSAIIRRPDHIEAAKNLFLDIHAGLHLSAVSGVEHNEVDALTEDLTPEEFAVMPTAKDETIAWVLWHIARIEDLTMNVLVARREQIFDARWQERLKAPIVDTGNALTDDEIMVLSHSIDTEELLRYRNQVGIRTREVVRGLNAADMKRKTDPEDIRKILDLGGVTEQEESVWLLDFWGKKDVAGLLLMPPTRHVMMHLNDCCKWKTVIRKKQKFYRC